MLTERWDTLNWNWKKKKRTQTEVGEAGADTGVLGVTNQRK